MGELVKKENSLIIQQEKEDGSILCGKVLRIDQTSPDFKGILNKVFQCANMAEVIEQIQKGVEYVVEIPSEFQPGVELGDFFMMQNQETGKMWPSLMRIGEDGKKKIVTPLPIVEKEFIEGNPFKDITENYHNLYLQGQLNELNQKLEETLYLAKRIIQGQKDDRIGLLNAGRNQILMALNQQDNSTRKQALQLGIHTLFEAHGQFEEALKTSVREFKALPKTKVMQFIRTLGDTNYFDKKADEYNEIEEYYDLYLQATKMLATAYIYMGEKGNAELLFENSMNSIGKIDFSAVQTIGYAFADSKDFLYDNAIEYLDTEKVYCLEDAKQYDGIEIIVTGDLLLEGLLDGRKEEV